MRRVFWACLFCCVSLAAAAIPPVSFEEELRYLSRGQSNETAAFEVGAGFDVLNARRAQALLRVRVVGPERAYGRVFRVSILMGAGPDSPGETSRLQRVWVRVEPFVQGVGALGESADGARLGLFPVIYDRDLSLGIEHRAVVSLGRLEWAAAAGSSNGVEDALRVRGLARVAADLLGVTLVQVADPDRSVEEDIDVFAQIGALEFEFGMQFPRAVELVFAGGRLEAGIGYGMVDLYSQLRAHFLNGLSNLFAGVGLRAWETTYGDGDQSWTATVGASIRLR